MPARVVSLIVCDHEDQPVAHARCRLWDAGDWLVATANVDGVVRWRTVRPSLRSTQVECEADGFMTARAHRDLLTGDDESLPAITMVQR